MRHKSALLILLFVATAMAVPLPPSAKNALAEPVSFPPANPETIQWLPGGADAYATLAWNPEWLMLDNLYATLSEITITIQGKDSHGQNIEAKVVVPAGTPPQMLFTFLDYHANPPKPVAFSYIDNVFQQGGTNGHVWACEILTKPVPWEEYMGIYHLITLYEPGQCYPTYPFGMKYLIGNGQEGGVTTQPYPLEPSNPDPLKVVINWYDSDHDLLPDYTKPSEFPSGGAQLAGTVYVDGSDEHGNKLGGMAPVIPGDKYVHVKTYAIDPYGVWTPENHTWSTVSNVRGGNKEDSYYILTEPQPERGLFIFMQPSAAMKTLTDGYFYIPGATPTLLTLIKIEMLFSNVRLVGDQTGNTTIPYTTINCWPNQKENILDIFGIARAFGSVEGSANWDYMKDVIPDRKINIIDVGRAAKNFGYIGTDEYAWWTTATPNVTVVFQPGNIPGTPDSLGFVTIPPSVTNFTVYQNGHPTGALVTFW